MSMIHKKSSRTSVYLLIILIAATTATLFSSLFTYRNALSAAEDSLKLQALGIAASLEASLQRSDFTKENLLRDIINESMWEGIAFLALYDHEGRVILHSNARIVGRIVNDPRIQEALHGGSPVHYYSVLGTDERVFMLDAPLHLQNNVYLLRLALHPYPAENSVRQARIHLAISCSLIAILWGGGLFLVRAQRRQEHLQQTIEDRERFAVLGEMAAVLAHEIRNPLGSIKGFAQYLLEQESKNNACCWRQPLEIIITETGRLEALTDDLLVYARPAEPLFTQFDLHELLSSVVANLPHRSDIIYRIDCPSPLVITSDLDKLRQIVTNLLQNAVDSLDTNASEGIITIAAVIEHDTIVIKISDTGSGMDAVTAAKIFEPFFTTKTRGTGLGLAIVDRLVKALHGRIHVESYPQKGTTFTVSLPMRYL